MSDHTVRYRHFHLSHSHFRRSRSHLIVFEAYPSRVLLFIRQTRQNVSIWFCGAWLLMRGSKKKELKQVRAWLMCWFICDVYIYIYSIYIYIWPEGSCCTCRSLHFPSYDFYTSVFQLSHRQRRGINKFKSQNICLFNQRAFCRWTYTTCLHHCHAILAHLLSHHTKSGWECLMQSWISQK